jgi:hypothetical protein
MHFSLFILRSVILIADSQYSLLMEYFPFSRFFFILVSFLWNFIYGKLIEEKIIQCEKLEKYFQGKP